MPISDLDPYWDVSKLNRTFASDEAIQAERIRTFNRVDKLMIVSAISFISGLLILVISFCVTQVWPSLQDSTPLTVFTAAGALQLAATFFLFFAAIFFIEKGQLLTPLADGKYCVEANDLVNRYAAARRIRDDILQQDRQLYVMDYVTIAKAARHETPDDEAKLKRAACASLHKLTTDA